MMTIETEAIILQNCLNKIHSININDEIESIAKGYSLDVRIRLVNIVEEVLEKMGIEPTNTKKWMNSLRRKSLVMQVANLKDFNAGDVVKLCNTDKLKEFTSSELVDPTLISAAHEPSTSTRT
jgi:hypothetical protein